MRQVDRRASGEKQVVIGKSVAGRFVGVIDEAEAGGNQWVKCQIPFVRRVGRHQSGDRRGETDIGVRKCPGDVCNPVGPGSGSARQLPAVAQRGLGSGGMRHLGATVNGAAATEAQAAEAERHHPRPRLLSKSQRRDQHNQKCSCHFVPLIGRPTAPDERLMPAPVIAVTVLIAGNDPTSTHAVARGAHRAKYLRVLASQALSSSARLRPGCISGMRRQLRLHGSRYTQPPESSIGAEIGSEKHDYPTLFGYEPAMRQGRRAKVQRRSNIACCMV